MLKKELPDGWEWKKLGEIGDIFSGSTPSTSDSENFAGNIPWITPADLSNHGSMYIERGKRNLSEKGLNNSSATLLPKGAILFSSRAPVGYVAIAAKPLTTNQGFKNLVLKKDDILPEYVCYYLRANTKLAEKYASGTTFLEVPASRFAQIPISIPPLETQRKIVAILEKAETTQRLRAEADALTQDLLQSVFLEMFGVPSIKSTDWPFERLGNVIGVTSGHGFKFEEYSDDGIRLLRINNVSFGDINWEQVAYLPFEYGDNFPNLVLKKDDILMALNRPILGNRLKVGMMDEEDATAILYQRVGRIDILDEERVNRQYLFHLLRTRYFLSELSARLSGSDQPYINPTAMVKIKIPLPPIAIQKMFADIATSIQLVYNNGDMSRNKMEILSKVIIDRAFTGEIVA
ncbi:restriction endonuclease subunit S [Methanocalculus sp. MC3]